MNNCLDAAIEYSQHGISVIPVNPANSKKNPKRPTIKSWKEYQDRIPTNEEVHSFFRNGANIAVICGKVSGCLEILDFDDIDVIEPFFDLLAKEIPHINKSLICQQSPSGGCHIIYRCKSVCGNQKLARSADGRKVRIETRGEGGYVLVAPSAGYMLDGNLSTLTTISESDREKLLAVARSFDLYESNRKHHVSQNDDTGRPGDHFNSVANFEQLLIDHGWQFLKTAGDRTQWVRPGKDKKEGMSATLHPEQGLFVFSTNTNLPAETPISPFQFITYSEYNGDFSEAARSLSQQGYGEDRKAKESKGKHGKAKGTAGNQLESNRKAGESGKQDESGFDVPINQLVGDFVDDNTGEFTTIDIDRELSLFTRSEKNARSVALNKLAKKCKVKKIQGKVGRWKIVKGDLHPMKLTPKKVSPLELDLPLGISRLADIMPGNIILVAGAPNSGKTAFLLSSLYTLLKKEKERTKEKEKNNNTTIQELVANGARYLNSEMDETELAGRCQAYPNGIEVFSNGCQFFERYRDFADLIIPNGVNFIDFLEIHQDFFELGKLINEIFEQLTSGICFIACQKRQGADYAKGGSASLEKPRLVINLDRNESYGKTCKIVKCKKAKRAGDNHDGKECDFDVRGHEFTRYSSFRYVDDKQRRLYNRDYETHGQQEIPDKEYAFILRLKDGKQGRIEHRQVDKWQESFPSVRVAEELRRIEADSRRAPFLDKGWFHAIPSMLRKKESKLLS